MKSLIRITLLSLFMIVLSSCGGNQKEITLSWPEVENTHKPWTRWWWHGSSVTEAGITTELQAYHDNGFGGFELTPIYGTIGDEENFIDFLSPEWTNMLVHTLNEASNMDMGIDMATGTGWPFGGPWILEENAAKYIAHKVYEVSEGTGISESIEYIQEPYYRHVGNSVYRYYEEGKIDYPALLRKKEDYTAADIQYPIAENENLQALALEQVRFEKPMPLVAIYGYNTSTGETVDLMEHFNSETNSLDWQATDGDYKVYAVFKGWHGKMVERAAPGGEGLVIDHFSKEALDVYLKKFNEAFEGKDISSLRAFFNDSYEVDDAYGVADFTDNFLEEFKNRRGYDLQPYFPALFNEDSSEVTNARVLIDYNRTVSDLLMDEFTLPWKEWAHGKDAIIRNQAHGSPANIIDLYAASDIPETEGTDLAMIKYASSAAHLTGKELASAEAATWLNEHFLSDLSDLKANVDRYFVGGINHVVYHGSCYSPVGEEWPGRLFYAAIHANPRSTMWDSYKVINEYITRTQSYLQNSAPDNDILLYYPIYDRYAHRGRELTQHFKAVGPSYENSTMLPVVNMLLEEGYAFDYITDDLIANLEVEEDGTILSGNSSYKSILLPECTYFDVKTMEKLQALADQGANIIFQNKLPKYALGLGNTGENQVKLEELSSKMSEYTSVHAGSDLQALLTQSEVYPETLVDLGFQYIRKKYDDETLYFINNSSDKTIDGWIPLNGKYTGVAILNPMTGQMGTANSNVVNEGEERTEVYMQAKPGESFIIRCSAQGNYDAGAYEFYHATDNNGLELTGNVQLEFQKGGPFLPRSFNIDNFQPWTDLVTKNDSLSSFSGTASYSTSFAFNLDDIVCDAVQIDLGEVYETAKVFLNDQEIGHSIGPDYSFIVSKEVFNSDSENTLTIQVSNLMANRISYMDKQKVPWKKFYNINFPANKWENVKMGLFDASDWEALPSGIGGPVKLQPVNVVKP